MGIKTENLGGTDWVDGNVLTAADLVDTIDANTKAAMTGMAQVPYTTLKSTGTWENEGHLAADRTTVAAGINGTINTGSTTSIFDTDKYNNIVNNTETQNAVSYSGGSSSSLTISGSITAVSGFFSQISWQRDRSGFAVTISATVTKNGTTIASKSFTSNSNAIVGVSFVKEDYSELLENGDSYTITITDSRDILKDLTGQTGDLFSTDDVVNTITFIEDYTLTESTLICDTNTLTLDGTENALMVYGDTTLPAGTSINVEISTPTNTPTGIDIENTGTTVPETGGFSTTDGLGIAINLDSSQLLKSITKGASTTATRARILDSNLNEIETVNFEGDLATFTSILNSGVTYQLWVDNNGSSYNVANGTSGIFPITSTSLTFISGEGEDEVTRNQAFGITKVITQELGSVSTSSSPIINNTSNIIDISSLTINKSISLKFTLETTDPTATPELYGYGVYKY